MLSTNRQNVIIPVIHIDCYGHKLTPFASRVIDDEVNEPENEYELGGEGLG